LEWRRAKGVKNSCHLSEKAAEDRKEVKEAAASCNAPVVDQWCRATKPRSPRAEYPLSNRN
jgi:hypothetical protein